MPVAWVYLLRCADGSLYCGWTNDLERRLAAHACGRGARYTASRRPVELALARPMPDSGAARREEARIKRLTRAEKLRLVDTGRSLEDGKVVRAEFLPDRQAAFESAGLPPPDA